MTYTHVTSNELAMIEAYYNNHQSVAKTAVLLNKSRQTIHKVYQFFKTEHNALDYFNQYKKNKTRCGRRPIVLSDEQTEYIQKRVVQGWTPDVIVGRAEFSISCSMRTLYRMFKQGVFELTYLPMKGKRKNNGHKETRENNLFVDHFVTEEMIILNSIKNLATLKGTLLWVKSTKVLLLPSLSDYLK